jgi:hypothetical protein
VGLSEDIREHIERVTEKVVVSVSQAVLDNLVDLNPVDTGHSRNNWIPTVGVPSETVDGSRKMPSAELQDAGRRTIAEYRLSDGAIYITNNVPYVIYLVLGHSPQAAPGWDRFAIEAGITEGTRRVQT